MFVHDQAMPLARRRTPEGFLHLRARIGRVGLHDYKAGEIGGPPGAAPDTIVRVYRPPDEVFDPASMASFAGKPVTSDHPPRMVDSANWKHFAVGHAGQSVARDGDHVATDLVITDAGAVARADSGAELSNGYWAEFDFAPGLTPAGEPYDAVQRNIRGNHIALVDAGRCGPSCTVGHDDVGSDRSNIIVTDTNEIEHDATRKSVPIFRHHALDTDASADVAADAAVTDCGCGEATRITLDGVVIEVGAAAAAAIARLEAGIETARIAHRREIEVRDGEIAVLKAAVPDAARLDALVAERAGVIDAARHVLGERFDGRAQSTAAIRRTAVERLLGPERLRGRGDDYVAAAFDALVAAAAPSINPLAAHLAAGSVRMTSPGAALAARDRYLTHAWKGETTGAA